MHKSLFDVTYMFWNVCSIKKQYYVGWAGSIQTKSSITDQWPLILEKNIMYETLFLSLHYIQNNGKFGLLKI